MPFEIQETYIPLAEKVVRRDGTIPLRIIAPGWGSSGYYSKEALQENIPKAFPPGTHMYWNHATLEEDAARPEGDLNRLAAVTVSEPRWQDDGQAGAGMYVDAKVFGQYAPVIDEIGEHIGVSIKAPRARVSQGTAEGREGRIVEQIFPAPTNSIDFVTRPGAGGKIVSIFESVGAEPIQEARNLGEWLESRLHLRLTEIGDNLYGEGQVNREERKALSAAIGRALDAYRTFLEGAVPQLFQRDVYEQAPASSGVEEAQSEPTAENVNPTEVDMSDERLQEAETALTEAQQRIQEQAAALERMREQLLLREARDFVLEAVKSSGLPEMTLTRLVRSLVVNPPVKEGNLDTAEYNERIKEAVTQAQTEIAAILGQDGRIRGNGQPVTEGAPEVTPEQAEQRITEALALAGYGGRNGNQS